MVFKTKRKGEYKRNMEKQTIHTRRQIGNEKPAKAVKREEEKPELSFTEPRTRAEYNAMNKHALSEMLTLREVPHNKRWLKPKLINLLLADDQKRNRDWG